MKVIGNKLCIKPFPVEEKVGGLHLNVSNEKPRKGEVIAVGEQVAIAKLGDKVLFGKLSGTQAEVDGENVLIIREEEILLIL
jgi:chaperonin GroES